MTPQREAAYLAVKLSAAQRKMLERFSEGDEVWATSGREPSAFWHSKMESAHFSTVYALQDRKLIYAYEHDYSGRKWRITDSGRKALAEAAEAEKEQPTEASGKEGAKS